MTKTNDTLVDMMLPTKDFYEVEFYMTLIHIVWNVWSIDLLHLIFPSLTFSIFSSSKSKKGTKFAHIEANGMYMLLILTITNNKRRLFLSKLKNKQSLPNLAICLFKKYTTWGNSEADVHSKFTGYRSIMVHQIYY